MRFVDQMAMKRPPHPGGFIRTEIIQSAGLSVNGCGRGASGFASGPAQLNGKADLSEDMALRIEKAFGVKMSTLCGCGFPAISRRELNLVRIAASEAIP
jgi:plasmid maintenance system antidote protein VapI